MEVDDINFHRDQSDVMTCAPQTSTKPKAFRDKSFSSAKTSTKPWRNGGLMASNGFFPKSYDQGISSPLSNSCIASVTNSNFFNELQAHNNQLNQQQSIFPQIDNFETIEEKVERMSDDSFDKYSGIDMKSPPAGLKAKRYNKTAEALKMSGLMDITMKTAELLKKNKQLQSEIDMLKKDSKEFLKTVLENPENHHLRDIYYPHMTQKS